MAARQLQLLQVLENDDFCEEKLKKKQKLQCVGKRELENL